MLGVRFSDLNNNIFGGRMNTKFGTYIATTVIATIFITARQNILYWAYGHFIQSDESNNHYKAHTDTPLIPRERSVSTEIKHLIDILWARKKR